MVATIEPDPCAELLVDFLNTAHLPDQDWLQDKVGRDWLASVGAGRRAVDAAGLEVLRALREGLRTLTRTDLKGGTPRRRHLETATRAVASAPMRLELSPDTRHPARLRAVGDAPNDRATAAVANALLAVTANGSFARVKTCADDDCQWAFFDGSRNLSRRWCLLDGCGNRAKNRTYRARRAQRA